MRILMMMPVYAIVSFLSYYYYTKAIYFDVLGDCWEAFAIASFFTLMCNYLRPNLHDQKQYFRDRQRPKNWIWPLPWLQKCTGGENKGPFRRPRSSLTWFNVGSTVTSVINIWANHHSGHLSLRLPVLLHPRFLHNRLRHHRIHKQILRRLPQPCIRPCLGYWL
jgi:hypothetical protein